MADPKDLSILVGIVESLEDPGGLERVAVRVPALSHRVVTEARLATPFGGARRGVFWKPEVGDEVLVAFEAGDPKRPYVLGGLWSNQAPPPPSDGKPQENNWRFIRSRSGHLLRFDDTRGAERIEIVDKDGTRRVVIDTSGSKILIECDRGDVEIKAQSSVSIDAATVDIRATGSMTLRAGGRLTIKGSICRHRLNATVAVGTGARDWGLGTGAWGLSPKFIGVVSGDAGLSAVVQAFRAGAPAARRVRGGVETCRARAGQP